MARAMSRRSSAAAATSRAPNRRMPRSPPKPGRAPPTPRTGGAPADTTRRAMTRRPKAREEAGLWARRLLRVHDELIFEAKDAEVKPPCAVVKRVREKPPEPAVKLTVPL